MHTKRKKQRKIGKWVVSSSISEVSWGCMGGNPTCICLSISLHIETKIEQRKEKGRRGGKGKPKLWLHFVVSIAPGSF